VQLVLKFTMQFLRYINFSELCERKFREFRSQFKSDRTQTLMIVETRRFHPLQEQE